MTGACAPEGRTRKLSLRFRLVALVLGTGVVPFVLTLVLLFPVIRREVFEAQGSTLAREAALLAAQVEVHLRAGSDPAEVHHVVASFRRGRLGRAYLYDVAGARLAGLPDLPTVPGSGDRPETGWLPFVFGRVPYLAGVAQVSGRRAPAALPGGPWVLAVVQPESEALAPLRGALERGGFFFAGISALALFFSWRLGEAFLVPLRKLRQGAEIMARTNLAHRIDIRTGDEMDALAQEFNRMGENLQRSYGALEQRVRDTTLHLSEERNRLAGVLRTMTEGVVLANEAGEVVLMTPRARLSLGANVSSGIGAPLAALLPPERLAFHLARVRRTWEKGLEAADPVVFPLADGRLLQGVLSAVRGPAGERAGVLFVFRDLRAPDEHGDGGGATLRELPQLLKGPAATLRSLVEVLVSRPAMEEEKRGAFLRAVQDEVSRLLERLHAAQRAAVATESARWPTAPCDPVALFREAAEGVEGVTVEVDVPDQGALWVRVEPYSWVRTLAAVPAWLRKSAPAAPIRSRLSLEHDAVVASFRVPALGALAAAELEALPLACAGEEVLSVGEAVRRNRGELWTRRSEGGFEVRLAFARAAPEREQAAPPASGLPEFYDFDLFLPHPAAEPSELLTTALTELDYVVFDTETTGLDPSRGDRLVSLSAVRVRRGKVAPAEGFHTLVQPGIPIPPESTRFHGLDDAAVAGAPTLADVFPQFRAFAGRAVLVAHNAAFDKKFLDLAAAALREPPLDNPVLDTLFLSYGLHGDLESHSLDAVARRLGVEIHGRHTSQGDARATAAVLVGLLPLLAARGITTLGDAKAFCDKMLLLRWRTSRF